MKQTDSFTIVGTILLVLGIVGLASSIGFALLISAISLLFPDVFTSSSDKLQFAISSIVTIAALAACIYIGISFRRKKKWSLMFYWIFFVGGYSVDLAVGMISGGFRDVPDFLISNMGGFFFLLLIFLVGLLLSKRRKELGVAVVQDAVPPQDQDTIVAS